MRLIRYRLQKGDDLESHKRKMLTNVDVEFSRTRTREGNLTKPDIESTRTLTRVNVHPSSLH